MFKAGCDHFHLPQHSITCQLSINLLYRTVQLVETLHMLRNKIR